MYFFHCPQITNIRQARTFEINASKVATLYGLIYQGAVLYLRQIDNFVLDGLPEKLGTFFGLIRDATIVCVDKKIFDQEDVVTKVT